jgi:transcriptional regulator with XRE-family HTH domain
VTRNVALAVAAARDGRPQYEIAAAAGVNGSDFSAFLTGRRQPTARARKGIARALGCNEEDLFPLEETAADLLRLHSPAR